MTMFMRPVPPTDMQLVCIKVAGGCLYHQAIAIVVEAMVSDTTTTLRWRSRCQAGDDGDHDVASMMEMKSTR